MKHHLLHQLAALAVLAFSASLHAAAPFCGGLENAYGPYDYMDPDARQTKLPLVEQYHFTPNIENLVKGNSGAIGGELDYTLRAFPNHHRALSTLVKLALRDKTIKPAGAKYSVECYFDRAIRFKSNDAAVRTIYSNYLLKQGHTDKAIEQLGAAIELQPEDPTINYNIGLLYVQKKDYEQALIHAKKAYELGFPLPGLRNKLVEAGKWRE
ncbi:tetratricopeptide repeat protein [Nitrosovibrio sp. Nv17]|uniref:tetratricopeptide repeat protein n=1 Tax=Nitrosovibrio sp. Nv17 TaxID=1855339 RepID=UPI00090858FC|nr:tetratricopeptide repeat protein [Nitrosovibrio sp. Nv17]SFW29973.1 TPR repeat-containing protein [Nitrosovibrio sp. Nv17]